MGFGYRLAIAAGLLAWAQGPRAALAWWENGHQAISEGVLQSLGGTGDLQRFIGETNDQFVKIPWIEPPLTHWIDIDTTSLTTGNAGQVSYATDFANFRAGTFTFPATTAAANARYGSFYVNAHGGVPWVANDALSTLTAKMQSAVTYDDWYRVLPTAGALAHYIQDMHNPMHLTQWYNGNPSSGLHRHYEGGQFEDGSVWRYPELKTAMTPVTPAYYGTGGGFTAHLFNRIPTDYDKNVLINNAHAAATSAGFAGSAPYYDALWEQTKSITKDSFHHAAATVAGALNTAYINAGSPAIPQATFFATPASENSTITWSGPVIGYQNQDFFAVGSGTYGVARFDLARIKEQFDQRYGPGLWEVDNVALATEINFGSGSFKVLFSQDDLTNIQQGSALRFADNGVPLGVDVTTATPLLEYVVPSFQPQFTIIRFDSNTPEAFNWLPLSNDIVSGDIITLIFARRTTGSINYFGGSGLSLEVSAHQVPEPAAVSLLALAGLAVMGRRSRG